MQGVFLNKTYQLWNNYLSDQVAPKELIEASVMAATYYVAGLFDGWFVRDKGYIIFNTPELAKLAQAALKGLVTDEIKECAYDKGYSISFTIPLITMLRLNDGEFDDDSDSPGQGYCSHSSPK